MCVFSRIKKKKKKRKAQQKKQIKIACFAFKGQFRITLENKAYVMGRKLVMTLG